MKRIVIDAETQRKLLHFMTEIELCDESGQVVARVIPSTPFNDPENWKWVGPDFTEKELQQRINSAEPIVTTQEIIEKIKGM
jgi:hypothetical protein